MNDHRPILHDHRLRGAGQIFMGTRLISRNPFSAYRLSSTSIGRVSLQPVPMPQSSYGTLHSRIKIPRLKLRIPSNHTSQFQFGVRLSPLLRYIYG